MKYDLIEDDMQQYVTAEDLLLAAFNLISYFYTQNALVKAYYGLDPDSLDERDKSDPVRKYMPGFVKSGE